jgi:hypothetical protein
MLVDRHHVQYLLDLGEVAQGKSAQQLAPLQDRLDAFLGTLAGAASPAARHAFEALMQRTAKDDRPWSAVRRPSATGQLTTRGSTDTLPPAVLLLLDQVDDDPDGEEDGNRLPNAGTAAAEPWTPLHDALKRWDPTELLRWIGPLGWQQPGHTHALIQDAELAVGPTSNNAPERDPPTPADAAIRAAQEADERSRKTLRTLGIAAAATGGGALIFGLGRALGRTASPTQSVLADAKEPTP